MSIREGEIHIDGEGFLSVTLLDTDARFVVLGVDYSKDRLTVSEEESLAEARSLAARWESEGMRAAVWTRVDR